MKNLIIYASRHSTTRNAGEILKKKLNGNTEIRNINKDKIFALDDFDNIIIGAAIYFGKIQKKLKEFVKENLDTLLNKKIALFICSGEENNEYIKRSFPDKLIKHAVSKQLFGGAILKKEMHFWENVILKTIKIQDFSRIKKENIEKLADDLNLSDNNAHEKK